MAFHMRLCTEQVAKCDGFGRTGMQYTSAIKQAGYKANFSYKAKIGDNFFVGRISDVDCSTLTDDSSRLK